VDLSDTALYSSGDAHAVWRTLRAAAPLFRQERDSGEAFWVVTRRADVRRVLAEHRLFTSEAGTAIAMLEAPDPAAGQMMQSTDPPRHLQYRRQLDGPFAAGAVAGQSEWIRQFVRASVAPALDGEVWDAAAAFSRLPMAVGAHMMGLPQADVDRLVHLAFASLAPSDPRFSAGTERRTSAFAHYDIIMYFEDHLADRRRNPGADLVSHLLSVRVDGRSLTDDELVLNCLSLLLGAVVTTSQAISATLIALAEAHGGEGRWPREAPLDGLVDEALRWSSPVLHFMRRARVDVEMHGRNIRSGEAVTAWIASANRDESVFERPFAFDALRSPNPHVTFGSGPHRCIGSNLARLMLREAFAELLAVTETFELAGEPVHLESNEIAGYISLPVRLRAAERAPGFPGARSTARSRTAGSAGAATTAPARAQPRTSRRVT
jgi:cytochrome P450